MINVSCAVIFYENRILAVQRGLSQDLSGKWEFPGGKVEQNESEEECLIREIKEELGLDIQLGKRLSSVEYAYEKSPIRLIPFIASIFGGELILTEHQAYKWLTPERLDSIDWAPADWPVVYQVQKSCKVRKGTP